MPAGEIGPGLVDVRHDPLSHEWTVTGRTDSARSSTLCSEAGRSAEVAGSEPGNVPAG